MRFSIINRYTGTVLFSGEGESLADVVTAAINAGVKLHDADLRGVKLRGSILSAAYLCDTNLSGADLHGVDLSAAYLCDTNLSGADLSGANLSGADLHGAKF